MSRTNLDTRLFPPHRPRLGALVWALAAALAIALGACEEAEDDYELKGELGAGSGGPEVNEDALESHDLTTYGGTTVIGSIQFDSSALLHYHPDPEDDSLHVVATVPIEQFLADVADGVIDELGDGDVLIFITPIFGRPDTPCRFQAALLARDDGFNIQGSGDRKTSRGRELHQVNLIKHSIPQTQRLYCYELDDPFGAQLTVYAQDAAHQEWRIVHAVLNSVEEE